MEVVVARLECQPGPVGAVRVFKAYDIPVFHGAAILCIAGIDLEEGLRIVQRIASTPQLA